MDRGAAPRTGTAHTGAEPRIPAPLRGALARARPDLDLDGARALGRGQDADVFLLPPVDGGAGAGDRAAGAVLRLPRHAAARDRLAAEPALLDLLRARGVPALPEDARPLRDASGAMVGVLHRYAAGEPAPRPLRGARRARLVRDTAAFLSALHRAPTDEAAAAGLRRVTLWPDEYAPLLAELRARTAAGRRVEAARARPLLRAGARLRRLREEHGPLPACVLHGDLQREHLLVGPTGALRCVIDWSYAMIADPALDFAGAGYALGWRFAEQVLAAYRPPPGVTVDQAFTARARTYLALAPLYGIVYP